VLLVGYLPRRLFVGVLRCFTGSSRVFQRWGSPGTYSHKPLQNESCLEQQNKVSLSLHKPNHQKTTAMRFHTQPIYAQTLRYYAQSTRATKADRLGAAVTAGYCCLAFSAPFAGAALVSKNAKKDGRYANLYASCFDSSSDHLD
jgi:hypothetical protein